MAGLLLGALAALAAFAWVLAPVFGRAAATAPAPACPEHGPRPESDARYCSECGRALTG